MSNTELFCRSTRLVIFSMILIMMSSIAAVSASTPTGYTARPPVADTLIAEARSALAKDSMYARHYGISVRLAARIRHAAERHGIPDSIAYAIVRVESKFNQRAVSPVGAIGLAQVMPETGWLQCRMRVSDLRIADKNLDCGFKFLKWTNEFFGGDWRLTLIGYHRGPGRTRRELRDGLPHGISTQYAANVLHFARRSQ